MKRTCRPLKRCATYIVGMDVTNLGGGQQLSLPSHSLQEGKFPCLAEEKVASHRKIWNLKLMHKIKCLLMFNTKKIQLLFWISEHF